MVHPESTEALIHAARRRLSRAVRNFLVLNSLTALHTRTANIPGSFDIHYRINQYAQGFLCTINAGIPDESNLFILRGWLERKSE